VQPDELKSPVPPDEDNPTARESQPEPAETEVEQEEPEETLVAEATPTDAQPAPEEANPSSDATTESNSNSGSDSGSGATGESRSASTAANGSASGDSAQSGNSNVNRGLLDAHRRRLSRAMRGENNCPRAAIRQRLNGVAYVGIRQNARGSVTSVVLKRSAGHDVLDQEAVKFAEGLRRMPAPPEAIRGSEFIVPVVFRCN
jgi:protein TonB